MKSKAIVLLSGGLDSTTSLYAARRDGYDVIALTVNYGQLHEKEIDAAKRTVRELGCRHFITRAELPWKGSALLDAGIAIPKGRSEKQMGANIPVTYVPARNTILLALAASCAETCKAEAVFIGANILDYSGYPDCRPEFFTAFEAMIQKATKVGVEGGHLRIQTPLIGMTKKEIVLLGQSLEVPFENTWSCYQGSEKPCGECDSCRLRAKGFFEAGVKDPLVL